jgi:hypothetical protein
MLVGVLVLALSACMAPVDGDAASSDDSELCQSEEVIAQVRGEVALPEAAQKSAGSSALWLTVYGPASHECAGEYVVTTSPGSALVHTQLDSSEFDVPVRYTTVKGARAESYELWFVLDQNGNGACDDGELLGIGYTDESGALAEPLAFEPGCPGRL